jgi:hypothetical protein
MSKKWDSHGTPREEHSRIQSSRALLALLY